MSNLIFIRAESRSTAPKWYKEATLCSLFTRKNNPGEDLISFEKQRQEDLEFLNNGLFCEWVYVVDLDDEVFEVYRGSGSGKKTEGHRFAGVGDENATVPKMMGRSFGAEDLARMTAEEFLDEIASDYEG